MKKRILVYVVVCIILIVCAAAFGISKTEKSAMTNKSTMPSSSETPSYNQEGASILSDLGNDDFPQKVPEESLLTSAERNLRAGFLRLYFLISGKSDEYLKSKQIHNLAKSGNWSEIKLLITLYKPEQLMDKVFKESNNGKKFNCHEDGHYIGRFSYIIHKEKAIKSITVCASGYMHSVLGTFIRYRGANNFLTYVPQACEKFKSVFEKQECYHASGHGLMAAVNNNLPKAVDLCSQYQTEFRRMNCYAGAFMENYSPITRPSSFPPKSKWVSTKDPHFPCNNFPGNTEAGIACYSVQFPWVVLSLLREDVSEMPKYCVDAASPLIRSCFFGFGQFAALESNLDPKSIVDLCNLSKDEFLTNSCLQGGQAIVMDFWGGKVKEHGERYCAAVPESYKEGCRSFLNSRLAEVH